MRGKRHCHRGKKRPGYIGLMSMVAEWLGARGLISARASSRQEMSRIRHCAKGGSSLLDSMRNGNAGDALQQEISSLSLLAWVVSLRLGDPKECAKSLRIFRTRFKALSKS